MISWDQWIIQEGAWIRSLISLGGLFLFLGWGLISPYRPISRPLKLSRWTHNLFFNFSNPALMFCIFPLGLVELANAHWIDQWSLLPFSGLPQPFEVFCSLLFLDFIIYWQHRLTHSIPLLWKLHRLHHSDTEFDTTTAGRFHFFEILLSFVLKACLVVLLAIPVHSIFLFEIILNFSALFKHGNFSLPPALEKISRVLFITPDLHRVHHSVIPTETNSNYGFSIGLWDRLFGSFRLQPQEDPKKMAIGLKEFRSKEEQKLVPLLLQPFK